MQNASSITESPRNPFVGLRPFNTDESILFFGRRQQTVELMQQLHRTHFIAVVGSSGCGKSSLIRAGLIPNLKAGFLVEDRAQWQIAVMKPGDAPLCNLASALDPAGETESLTDAIRTGGAQAILETLSPALADSDTNLLLLVDQFEEIFRFGIESGKAEQRAEAADFVSIMLALAKQRTLPIYVVMTMRSDFLGDCDNFYGLPEALNRSQYLVPRLTRQQRQQAIESAMEFLAKSRSAESRRKRLIWSVVAMAFVVLLSLTFYAWWQQQVAKRQEQNANQLYYAANMNLAQDAYENRKLSGLHDLLNTFLPSKALRDVPLSLERRVF